MEDVPKNVPNTVMTMLEGLSPIQRELLKVYYFQSYDDKPNFLSPRYHTPTHDVHAEFLRHAAKEENPQKKDDGIVLGNMKWTSDYFLGDDADQLQKKYLSGFPWYSAAVAKAEAATATTPFMDRFVTAMELPKNGSRMTFFKFVLTIIYKIPINKLEPLAVAPAPLDVFFCRPFESQDILRGWLKYVLLESKFPLQEDTCRNGTVTIDTIRDDEGKVLCLFPGALWPDTTLQFRSLTSRRYREQWTSSTPKSFVVLDYYKTNLNQTAYDFHKNVCENQPDLSNRLERLTPQKHAIGTVTFDSENRTHGIKVKNNLYETFEGLDESTRLARPQADGGDVHQHYMIVDFEKATFNNLNWLSKDFCVLAADGRLYGRPFVKDFTHVLPWVTDGDLELLIDIHRFQNRSPFKEWFKDVRRSVKMIR